jgi:hypothetical protein
MILILRSTLKAEAPVIASNCPRLLDVHYLIFGKWARLTQPMKKRIVTVWNIREVL